MLIFNRQGHASTGVSSVPLVDHYPLTPGLLLPRCWRKPDSNPRSHLRLCRSSDGGQGPGTRSEQVFQKSSPLLGMTSGSNPSPLYQHIRSGSSAVALARPRASTPVPAGRNGMTGGVRSKAPGMIGTVLKARSSPQRSPNCARGASLPVPNHRSPRRGPRSSSRNTDRLASRAAATNSV